MEPIEFNRRPRDAQVFDFTQIPLSLKNLFNWDKDNFCVHSWNPDLQFYMVTANKSHHLCFVPVFMLAKHQNISRLLSNSLPNKRN